MLVSHFRGIAVITVLLLLVAGILACELPGLGGGTKPTVVILSPASGTQAKAGETVAIQPSPRLKPLPILEGFVPDGWKDALYE